MRFKKLRRRYSDYEKIRMIRELAAKSTNKNVKDLMNALINTSKHLLQKKI
jgi:hypothetical protein